MLPRVGNGGFPDIWKTTHVAGIDGLPCIGKTTVLRRLSEKYNVHVIKRATSRPRRDGEDDLEYDFHSQRDFDHLEEAGHFLDFSIHTASAMEGFKTAIPKIEYWLNPPKYTDIVVALLGRLTPTVKADLVPFMRTFFINVIPEQGGMLMKRTWERSLLHGQDPMKKLEVIHDYWEKKPWWFYDHIVFNNEKSRRSKKKLGEKCAEDIMRILSRPPLYVDE